MEVASDKCQRVQRHSATEWWQKSDRGDASAAGGIDVHNRHLGQEDETQQGHDPRVEHRLHLVPENARKMRYQAWCESRCRRQQIGRWPHDFLLHWIDSALKIPVAYQRVLLHYTAHSLRTHRALVQCLGYNFRLVFCPDRNTGRPEKQRSHGVARVERLTGVHQGLEETDRRDQE